MAFGCGRRGFTVGKLYVESVFWLWQNRGKCPSSFERYYICACIRFLMLSVVELVCQCGRKEELFCVGHWVFCQAHLKKHLNYTLYFKMNDPCHVWVFSSDTPHCTTKFLSLVMELPTLHWSTNTDADEMKSQALINARRAFQDQEARVQYVLLLENVSLSDRKSVV